MEDSALSQEVEIAKSEADKMIADPKATIEDLRRLRKNIDEKRKALCRPLRLQIKETDQLFAGPIQKLKAQAQILSNNKK